MKFYLYLSSECVFATKRVKTSSTRIAESSLKYQLESLQMRCKLLAKEKQETKEKLKETEHKSNVLKEELNTKNSIMMNNIRDLSRERTNFYRWFETFNLHVQSNRNWSNALKEQRLHVIRSFNDVFPIGTILQFFYDYSYMPLKKSIYTFHYQII